MNATQLEELQALVDDSALLFDETGDLELVTVEGGKRVVVATWALADIVDGMIDAMGSDDEADDMLDLARHLSHLAKRIRSCVNDYNQPRGD